MRAQAPELFAFPAVVSAAADVYAFAVLAWVVCTREKPYQNLQSADTVMASMLTQGVRPELPDGDDWRDATTAGLLTLTPTLTRTRTLAALVWPRWSSPNLKPDPHPNLN